MNYYDEIGLYCPHCGAQVYVKTKVGSCAGSSYDMYSAPPKLLLDVAGQRQYCTGCGMNFKVNISLNISCERVYE